MNRIEDFRKYVNSFSMAPDMSEMFKRTLKYKGIDGPTVAHVIEEIHTPLNLHFIAVTTGSTALQNIVGVTKSELNDRVSASIKAFEILGLKKGSKILFTYPPLVNAFPKEALEAYEIESCFLKRSSREHLIVALYAEKPDIVIGESTFMKMMLMDAKKMNLIEFIPKGITFVAAGTPLDMEFIEVAKEYVNGTVHDFYGCQEFGWLTMDGIPLRDDFTLMPADDEGYSDLIIGGLSTGDRFPVGLKGHVCDNRGKILTYDRRRTMPEYETTIVESTAKNVETLHRLTRSILRIKGKIIRVAKDVKLNCDKNVLTLSQYGSEEVCVVYQENAVRMFESLLEAQLEYQSQKKNDPTWIKGR
ncbi:MAG: hypothetical protein ACK5LT_11555 [Lachnospirales bacterium]